MRARRIARRRGSNPRRPTRGGGSVSLTYPFTLDSLVPNTVNQGAANTPVNANGQDFQSGSNVFIDGASQATTFVNATLLTFTFPAALALVPGYKTIVVKRTTFTSNARLFAVLFPVPTVTSASLAGNVLSVGGTGFFAQGTRAFVDTTLEVPFTYLTATTGTCLIPQSVLDVPGVHTIRIFNDAPGGGASGFRNFDTKYKNSILVSLSATQQYRGRDSGTIVLTGDPGPDSIFYSVSDVKVDGTSVAFTLIDVNHVSFNIPGALLMTAGNHAITVSNPTTGGGGGTSNALQFFAFAPTFDAISISAVPQYFDGFDVMGHVDMIDGNFEAAFNGVAQPTTLVDTSNFIVSITSAAIAVPGVTTITLRDKISGAITNAKTMTVAAWDPSRLGATLRYWGDGTSLVNDGAGFAQAWNDMSGGARHFLQATAAKRPQIIAASASLNNKPAARFNSANATNLTYTQWIVSAAIGLINKDKYTIYVVGVYTGAGTGQTVLGETNGYIRVGAAALSPNRRFDNTDSSGPGNTVFYADFDWVAPPNKPFALRFRKGGGNCGARVNRAAEYVATHGTSLPAFQPVLAYLGSAAAGGVFMNGDLGEIIICDTDLNATQKAILDNRLSYLYALPFSSPGTQPKISSITPSSCSQYDLPFWILVEDLTGSYTPASVVNAFDQVLVTEYLSPTQLRARLTNDVLAQAGGMAISVANANGISAPTGLTIFAYADAPGVPNIHTTVPNVGQRFNDPVLVRVLGAGFTASSVINWNGNPLATTFISAIEIRATLPAPAFDLLPGPILTVTDPSGTSPTSAEITLTDWSPLSIVGLTGWWDVVDVIVAGGKVTQFTDKSGNGRHFTQSDTTKQAIYSASDAAFNGKPSAQFDGIDDQYSGVAISTLVGTADSVFASVYRYLVVDGAGVPTQPYVNDVMISGPSYGIAAHASPLTLLGFAHDGTAYQNVANAGLVVGQTQRCQFRINALVMTMEIGSTASAPFTLATFAPGASSLLAYVNFGTNNAMNGKLACWLSSNRAWTAQDSICWKNFSRYNYGTTA